MVEDKKTNIIWQCVRGLLGSCGYSQKKEKFSLQEEDLEKTLPIELQLNNLYEIIEQEYKLKNQQHLIAFKSMYNQEIPLYLFHSTCTPRNVKLLLATLNEVDIRYYLTTYSKKDS